MYGQKSVSQRKICFFFYQLSSTFFRDNLMVEKMFNLSHSLLVLAQQSFLTTETQLEVFRLSPTGDDAAATSPLRKSRLLRSASVPPPPTLRLRPLKVNRFLCHRGQFKERISHWSAPPQRTGVRKQDGFHISIICCDSSSLRGYGFSATDAGS